MSNKIIVDKTNKTYNNKIYKLKIIYVNIYYLSLSLTFEYNLNFLNIYVNPLRSLNYSNILYLY